MSCKVYNTLEKSKKRGCNTKSLDLSILKKIIKYFLNITYFMIKKITLALSILFIFIIAVSAVSAEDNMTAPNDEIVSIEDETGTFE